MKTSENFSEHRVPAEGPDHRCQGAQQGRNPVPEAASEASLGNLRNMYAGEGGKTPGEPSKIRPERLSKTAAKNARRSERMELQRTAARLTPNLRVAHCLWTPTGQTVELLRRQADARFQGVQTCGSVWNCPCCSARISEVRRGELRQLEEWAGSPKRGLRLVMMTLTARHRNRALRDLVDRLGKAWRRMQNRKGWQRFRQGALSGYVRVIEATHGAKNGWHPHYHVLLLIEADSDEQALAMLEPFRAVWLDCLRKEGLTGTAQRAFHIQAGDAVSAYISKHGRYEADQKAATKARQFWGIAEEMTLARTKRGRGEGEGKGRSPWQILRDAHSGDEASEKLWQEYALVMHGRRQQVWSDGLKEKIGLLEIEDEEAAEGEEYTEDADETLAVWTKAEWRRVRSRRAEILAAAEAGGDAVAVERAASGPDEEVPDLIEDEPMHQPRPGGLGARLQASIWPMHQVCEPFDPWTGEIYEQGP